MFEKLQKGKNFNFNLTRSRLKYQQNFLSSPILVFLTSTILKKDMNCYSNQFGARLKDWVEAGLIRTYRLANQFIH